MITKSKFWKMVREELKHKHRADKTTEKVMSLIKDVPQHEDKENEA